MLPLSEAALLVHRGPIDDTVAVEAALRVFETATAVGDCRPRSFAARRCHSGMELGLAVGLALGKALIPQVAFLFGQVED